MGYWSPVLPKYHDEDSLAETEAASWLPKKVAFIHDIDRLLTV